MDASPRGCLQSVSEGYSASQNPHNTQNPGCLHRDMVLLEIIS
jgi:hypothetical protein